MESIPLYFHQIAPARFGTSYRWPHFDIEFEYTQAQHGVLPLVL